MASSTASSKRFAVSDFCYTYLTHATLFGKLATMFQHLACTSAIHCTQSTGVGDLHQARFRPKTDREDP